VTNAEVSAGSATREPADGLAGPTRPGFSLAPPTTDSALPAPVPPLIPVIVPTPPIAPFRWAAILIGLIILSPFGGVDGRELIAVSVLVAYAAYRTARPLRYDGGRATLVALILDAAIHTEVVLLTGIWSSPFTFSLVPPVLQAGFARGAAFAVRLTVALVVAVSIAHVATVERWTSGLRDASAWMAVLVVVALLSGLARQLTADSAQQQSAVLDRLEKLTEANVLLNSLNRIALSLPASLDVRHVYDATVEHLRPIVPFDTATLYVFDDTDHTWRAVRSGMRPPQVLAALPRPVLDASWTSRARLVTPLTGGEYENSRSGIYARLTAQGTLVGVLAIEATTPDRFDDRDVHLVNGLLQPLGVAIDNARLFARLRGVGAQEERNRIARDLHDHIGQSLASLAFGLDRAKRMADRGEEVAPVLDDLRSELRGTVREVREALYDMRADVSEARDLDQTLVMFLARLRGRTSMAVSYERRGTGRLPLGKERELWQIALEAIRNAERHSGAATLHVRWTCDGRSGLLEVVDDGRGFERALVPGDAFGIVGMRERAGIAGATLDIDSHPGAGTAVRVRVEPKER
jgi:signal transduction histidine kinase